MLSDVKHVPCQSRRAPKWGLQRPLVAACSRFLHDSAVTTVSVATRATLHTEGHRWVCWVLLLSIAAPRRSSPSTTQSLSASGEPTPRAST